VPARCLAEPGDALARAGLPGLFGTPSEIDTARDVAAELEVSPAAVALAWVHGRPGISSTIIGARRTGQLEANLTALDVMLTEDQRHRLDEVSAPQLGFPVAANRIAPMLEFGGTTVDGQAWDQFPTLASSSNRY
jgi:diketogulonate reductase-like aldo/keto reductase